MRYGNPGSRTRGLVDVLWGCPLFVGIRPRWAGRPPLIWRASSVFLECTLDWCWPACYRFFVAVAVVFVVCLFVCEKNKSDDMRQSVRVFVSRGYLCVCCPVPKTWNHGPDRSAYPPPPAYYAGTPETGWSPFEFPTETGPTLAKTHPWSSWTTAREN